MSWFLLSNVLLAQQEAAVGRNKGESGDGVGVYGHSFTGVGVRGESLSVGVHGMALPILGWGAGVYGQSSRGIGVYGHSNFWVGVSGESDTDVGVYGGSNSRPGVVGRSGGDRSDGVYGEGSNGVRGVGATGVRGEGTIGVEGVGYFGTVGESTIGPGVFGWSTGSMLQGNSAGVAGYNVISNDGIGVFGMGRRVSLYGDGPYPGSGAGYAAYLDGDTLVTGDIYKGGAHFKIDHPLDPANKYLYHSAVESPDRKNVYDGLVVLDNKGEAEIELPDWFGALNKEFRYQLTAIGAPGPNLYIAEEISDGVTDNSNSRSSNKNNNSRFKVAGGTSGMKVSWQVTGIREDPYAKAHPIHVEEDKPVKERGYYLHPDLYGQPAEKGISRLFFPKEKQELLIKEMFGRKTRDSKEAPY